MKRIITALVFLILLNCKTKSPFEGQFLAALEVTANTIEKKPVDFNVGYTIAFKQTENQDCIVESKEELNSIILEPTVRSVIRSYVGQLDDDGIAVLDKEEIKAVINKELLEADISINAKKLVDCPFEVTMFVLTRRK